MRGNPPRAFGELAQRRAIPACAGEPDTSQSDRQSVKVYPRVCGGTALPDELRAPEEFVVLPENWDAVRVFCAAASQWRMGLSGHCVGLDYAGVRVVADTLGVALQDVFGRI